MRFTIYHTNDIHSNYAFLKKVHSFMHQNKKENDLYFDSGDFNDLKSVLVQSDKGLSAMELFLECKLDAMAIGNNEIDLEYEGMTQFIRRGFPVICCNLTDKEDKEIEGLMPYQCYERFGKTILVIGVAPYFGANMKPSGYNLFFEMGNLKTQDTILALKKVLNERKGSYDYCVLLSHSGFKVDMELRKQLPEIDLFLGGHSHTIFSEAGYSQSGLGERIGKIELEIIDGVLKEVSNVQIEPLEVENPVFDKILAHKEKIADEILSKELPILRELDFQPFEESELINFLCDCMKKEYGGDLAIMHSGIAENGLYRPVSEKSLLLTFPSKLNPTMYSIKGAFLREALELSWDKEHIRGSGNGAGFRGSVLGTLGVSANVKMQEKSRKIWIDGMPLEDEKMYRIVTDDYLQRGTGYPTFKVPNEVCEYDMWFIRDLVKQYLMDEEVFALAKEKRHLP